MACRTKAYVVPVHKMLDVLKDERVACFCGRGHDEDEEAGYVELKLALSSSLRQWRTRRGVDGLFPLGVRGVAGDTQLVSIGVPEVGAVVIGVILGTQGG